MILNDIYSSDRKYYFFKK